jgi:hypothetical protein
MPRMDIDTVGHKHLSCFSPVLPDCIKYAGDPCDYGAIDAPAYDTVGHKYLCRFSPVLPDCIKYAGDPCDYGAFDAPAY